MRNARLIISSFCIASVLAQICFAEGAPKELTLQVSVQNNLYKLSVPISRLIMALPKDNLLQKQMKAGGATDSPRYFYFSDKEKYIVVSGWFESSQGYLNFNKYWNDEKKAWQFSNSSPTPINEGFFKLSGWDAVTYDTPIGGNVISHHIKVHLVQAGTWIDLHLSISAENYDPKAHETLMNILKSIEVNEKS